MPSSAVQTFSDPDEYAAAIRATSTEFTVTGRGQFGAKLIRIDLHRLWLQRASDNLPRISHPTNIAGRAVLSFRTQPGPSLLRMVWKCSRPTLYATATVRAIIAVHPGLRLTPACRCRWK